MPINILHLISSPYGLGGAEKLLLDMAEYYDDKKFAVTYCNLFNNVSENSVLTQSLIDLGLPQIQISGHRWYDIPNIIYQLKTAIKKNNIHIVHAHLFHSTLISAVLDKIQGKYKSVFTRHYTENALSNSAFIKLDRKAFKTADSVVAISSSVKNDLLKIGVRNDKIRLIPNGIDVDLFDARADMKTDFYNSIGKSGKYIICSVGNLHSRKDHLTLVEAMSEVVKIYSQAHLVIVGEGPERGVLERAIVEKKLEEYVTLAGFQENIPAILKGAHAYAHSAKIEPFGIAILEAMAARLPVVSTAVDGVVDIIRDGENGYLAPPQNAAEIADRICKVIKYSERASELAQKGREKVEKVYRIENVVEAYQNLYTEIY